MFLVRSIRRRLVSGFAVTIILMFTLAGAGIQGLFWHRSAVEELDFLIWKSPNRIRLSREISRISEAIFQPIDFRKPSAAELAAGAYRRQIAVAESELGKFRSCVEDLPASSQLLRQRHHVLTRIDGVAGELHRLSDAAADLFAVINARDVTALMDFRLKVQFRISGIQRILDNLPAYEDRQFNALSLEKDRSERLLTLIAAVALTAVVLTILTMYLGFRWVSIPLRNVAGGAVRIANGDFSYRIPVASPWQDEFSDLVDGVNQMADRFQEAEQDLLGRVKERSEQLVRSQRLAGVGFLAAGLAHEINNPMSIIRLAAESVQLRLYGVINESDPDGAEIAGRIRMILSESVRVADITRRLLNFSRSEKSEMQSGDLVFLIREVITMVSQMKVCEGREVTFDRTEPFYVEMNASHLRQVFLNLLANAVQATDEGGHVSVTLTEKVDFVQVIVSDDGCGMSAETLQHIFDPFFTTKEAGQGTGLGLSITHRLIEDHHGTILPFSEGPGKGSSFRIRLPKRQPVAEAA